METVKTKTLSPLSMRNAALSAPAAMGVPLIVRAEPTVSTVGVKVRLVVPDETETE